jgi:hypothetical protein
MKQSEKQLVKELELILEVIALPGFQYLLEEWQSACDLTLKTAPRTCDTDAKWQKCRGELAVYEYILSTEDRVRSALAMIEEGDNYADERNPLEDPCG